MQRLCAAIVLLPAFTWCFAGRFDPARVYDRLDRSRLYPDMMDPARTAPPTNRPQAGTARVERAKESAQ